MPEESGQFLKFSQVHLYPFPLFMQYRPERGPTPTWFDAEMQPSQYLHEPLSEVDAEAR